MTNKECERLKNCSFMKAFESTNDFVVRGLIINYCKGPKMESCKRKELLSQGKEVPTNMLPNGALKK